MKKFNLSIQTVEDRTAPAMFTERNLPGMCCCSCCCSCCWGGGSATQTQSADLATSLSLSEIAGLKGMSVKELQNVIATDIAVNAVNALSVKGIAAESVNWGRVSAVTLQ